MDSYACAATGVSSETSLVKKELTHRSGPIGLEYKKRVVKQRQKRAALAPVQRPEEIVQEKGQKQDDTITFVKRVRVLLYLFGSL